MSSATDFERAQVIARALRAAAHPARVLALEAFAESALSPIELSRRFGRREYSLGVVAYHVRRLAAAGLIDLAETIPRRGAVEHRYVLSRRGTTLVNAIAQLAE